MLWGCVLSAPLGVRWEREREGEREMDRYRKGEREREREDRGGRQTTRTGS